MNSNTIKIKNAKGILLHAKLDLPANQKPDYYAVFVHCFSCNSNFKAVRNISRVLTNHGFGVLRFDFTGLGLSEGAFADSHFEANVTDLIDVCNYLSDNFQAPSLLIGHSLGGSAAIIVGAQLPSIKGVVTIGAPSNTKHVKQLFSHGISEVEKKGIADVFIGTQTFKINQNFIDNFGKDELLKVVGKMKKPLLVMHAPTDRVVDVKHAQQLFLKAFHPKSFISLDNADHLLSNKVDSIYVANVIGSWVSRYLPPKEKISLDTEGEQLIGHLNLKENNFTTNIQTARHTLTADEPTSVGGDDFGMSPYDLLVASLAACVAMTLKLYAQRKKWDLQEVYVYLSHKKKHSQDIQNANGSPAYLDVIKKRVKFVGNLDEQQVKRLQEISARCPVHRTLLGEVVIETDEN